MTRDSHLTAIKRNLRHWILKLWKELRKSSLLDVKQYKENRTMLRGWQIMLQFFSLFDINKTQGRVVVGLTGFLNIELYNDNLKHFNQAWKEMLLSLDKGVDGEMLPNLYDGQVKISSIVKHGLSLYHSDIFLKKELQIDSHGG